MQKTSLLLLYFKMFFSRLANVPASLRPIKWAYLSLSSTKGGSVAADNFILFQYKDAEDMQD